MFGRILPMGGPPIFDPTTLSLSAYWRANYPGSAPWNATATAGVSSTTGALATNGSDPSSGTAVNGKTPAHFNGTANNLTNSTDVATGNVWTTTAFTIFCLFNVASAVAASGNIYDDPTFIRDSNTDTGMSFTTSGVTGYAYDGSYKAATKACTTGAWHLAMVRFNGSTIGVTVDSAAEVTSACTTLAVLTGSISVGVNYGASKFLAADIAELGCAAYSFSNTDYSNLKSYVNATYGLSL